MASSPNVASVQADEHKGQRRSVADQDRDWSDKIPVQVEDDEKIPVEPAQDDHHDAPECIVQPSPAATEAPLYPQHPIPCMQEPFEESIMESKKQFSPQKLYDKLDAELRRRQILELESFDEGHSSRWKQKPGAKFHPLWKLVAQISFGVNLIYTGKAKSEDIVVRILQSHVDEVDCFVEDTTADFELAIQDIEERITYLDVPLGYGRAFNKMLCDKNFRQAIIDGNDIIERVIERTRKAMDAALHDVEEGVAAITELYKFLDRIGRGQLHQNTRNVFSTMQGNVEGWAQCFVALQGKGERLSSLMSELTTLMDEVAKRAGIASRRNTPTGVRSLRKSMQVSPDVPSPKPSKRRTKVDKPLPPDPMNKAMAYAAPSPRARPSVHFEDLVERPKTADAFLEAPQEPKSPERPQPQRSSSDEGYSSPIIAAARASASIGLGIENTPVQSSSAASKWEASRLPSDEVAVAEKSSENDSPQVKSPSAESALPKAQPQPLRATYSTFPRSPETRVITRSTSEGNVPSSTASPEKPVSTPPFSPESFSTQNRTPITRSISLQETPSDTNSPPTAVVQRSVTTFSLSPLTSNPVTPQHASFSDAIKNTLQTHIEEVEDEVDDHEEAPNQTEPQQEASVDNISPKNERWPSLSENSVASNAKPPSQQDSAYSSGLTTSRVSEELPSLGLSTPAIWASSNAKGTQIRGNASMTALPSFEPPSPERYEGSLGSRKPSFGRKSSIASFKAMFVKKPPPPRREERILSSGGLGGCVLLSEV